MRLPRPRSRRLTSIANSLLRPPNGCGQDFDAQLFGRPPFQHVRMAFYSRDRVGRGLPVGPRMALRRSRTVASMWMTATRRWIGYRAAFGALVWRNFKLVLRAFAP